MAISYLTYGVSSNCYALSMYIKYSK